MFSRLVSPFRTHTYARNSAAFGGHDEELPQELPPTRGVGLADEGDALSTDPVASHAGSQDPSQDLDPLYPTMPHYERMDHSTSSAEEDHPLHRPSEATGFVSNSAPSPAAFAPYAFRTESERATSLSPSKRWQYLAVEDRRALLSRYLAELDTTGTRMHGHHGLTPAERQLCVDMIANSDIADEIRSKERGLSPDLPVLSSPDSPRSQVYPNRHATPAVAHTWASEIQFHPGAGLAVGSSLPSAVRRTSVLPNENRWLDHHSPTQSRLQVSRSFLAPSPARTTQPLMARSAQSSSSIAGLSSRQGTLSKRKRPLYFGPGMTTPQKRSLPMPTARSSISATLTTAPVHLAGNREEEKVASSKRARYDLHTDSSMVATEPALSFRQTGDLGLSSPLVNRKRADESRESRGSTGVARSRSESSYSKSTAPLTTPTRTASAMLDILSTPDLAPVTSRLPTFKRPSTMPPAGEESPALTNPYELSISSPFARAAAEQHGGQQNTKSRVGVSAAEKKKLAASRRSERRKGPRVPQESIVDLIERTSPAGQRRVPAAVQAATTLGTKATSVAAESPRSQSPRASAIFVSNKPKNPSPLGKPDTSLGSWPISGQGKLSPQRETIVDQEDVTSTVQRMAPGPAPVVIVEDADEGMLPNEDEGDGSVASGMIEEDDGEVIVVEAVTTENSQSASVSTAPQSKPLQLGPSSSATLPTSDLAKRNVPACQPQVQQPIAASAASSTRSPRAIAIAMATSLLPDFLLNVSQVHDLSAQDRHGATLAAALPLDASHAEKYTFSLPEVNSDEVENSVERQSPLHSQQRLQTLASSSSTHLASPKPQPDPAIATISPETMNESNEGSLGGGEENETTLCEARAKVFVFRDNSWVDFSICWLRVKSDCVTSRKRLLARNETTDRVILNFGLYPELKVKIEKNVLSFLGFDLDAKPMNLRCKIKTESAAQEFGKGLQAACEGI